MVTTLLDAAARLLVREGYAGVNTNAIAKQAGISIGSLYQYFPSKDALIAAVHERHAMQIRARFAGLLSAPRPRSLEEAVSAWVSTMLEAHRVEPRLHRALESEVPHLVRPGGRDEDSTSARTALKELIQPFRSRIKVKPLDAATYVACEIAAGLTEIAAIGASRALDSGVIERETVRAVFAYLTSDPLPALRKRRH
jgi:AcrR family transcriptional regulator